MTQKIEDVLFPVNLQNIFIENNRKQGQASLFDSTYDQVRGFKAVTAEDNSHVFAVVAQNYRLVTNKEAIDLAEICFGEVFKVLKAKEMAVFNVIMPKTRSFCHVDFVHPKATNDYFDKDPWTPYLRVTNSYNRMFALNFDLGFCRGICKNGVIFGRKNIEFKFYHSRTATDPVVKFKLRAGELANLEAQFIESLVNLKRFHVPPKVMWPLVCKVFGFKFPEEPTERQLELIFEKKDHVQRLCGQYFAELGENGYAAMNVLTDYASRPVGMISPEGNIDSLQRKSGDWIADFVSAIEARNFSFDSYLGDYARLAA